MSQQTNPNGDLPTCSIEEFTGTPFDYIICGGGTAGCTIAARLSENPDVNVGVIEAGKYRIGDPLVDTPGALFQLFENPEYDWCMYTEPQVCLGGHDTIIINTQLTIHTRLIIKEKSTICPEVNSWADQAASTT